MADEVLKLIVTADPSKVLATFKQVEEAANKVAASSKKAQQGIAASALVGLPPIGNILGPEFAKARAGLDELRGALGMTASEASNAMSHMGALGPAMTAIGGPMAIVTGALIAQATALGVFTTAFIAAGSTFHDVMATMAGRTGETGARLQALGNDFLSVFASVPQSAAEVSDVVTKLHARFDLTGETLKTVSTGMLNFARVTGTPVKAAMDSLVQVMSSWDVSAKDMPKLMDMMTVAFHKSNVEVPKLAGYLEGNDEALKQFGFNLTSSIALITNFEKRGVNIQKIMTGLNKAAPGFADAGVDPVRGLQDSIRVIKELDNQHALLAARQIFGQKVAVEFVGAIKGGAFDIAAMTTALEQSEGATAKAAAAAFTLMDMFNQLKNATTASLMPLGKDLVDALTQGVIPAFSVFYYYLHGVIDQLTWLAGHTIKPLIPKGGLEGIVDFALGTSLTPGGAPRFKNEMLSNKELFKQAGMAAPAVDFSTGGTGLAGLDARRTWPTKAEEEFRRIMSMFDKAKKPAAGKETDLLSARFLNPLRFVEQMGKPETASSTDKAFSAEYKEWERAAEEHERALEQIASFGVEARLALATDETMRKELQFQKEFGEFEKTEFFKTKTAADQVELRMAFVAKYAAVEKAASDKRLLNLQDEIDIAAAAASGRNKQESEIFELLARQAKDRRGVAGPELAKLETKQQWDQLRLMQSQYDETFGKIKTQAEGVFDAIFTRGRKGFAGLLDYIKGVFVTGIKDAFGTLVASIFAGPRPGGAKAEGGLLGAVSSLFGGGGGFNAGNLAGGGNFGSRIKAAFGFGGAAATAGAGAAGTAFAGTAATAAGELALPTTFSALRPETLGGAGASAAGGSSFFGLSGAQLGAFFTNPFTIAAGIGIAATIAYLKLRKTREEKFRAEILRDFAINVPDNKILKQIKNYGETVFGKDADKKRFETLRLDQIQGLLLNYAVASGQDPSRLPIHQKFYGTASRSLSFDPSRGVPAFEFGTPYVPRTGLAMVHQGEAIIPAGQNLSGGMNITVNVDASNSVDPAATARLAKQAAKEGVKEALESGRVNGFDIGRALTRQVAKTLQGDFKRRDILDGLIGT